MLNKKLVKELEDMICNYQFRLLDNDVKSEIKLLSENIFDMYDIAFDDITFDNSTIIFNIQK